MPRVLGRCRSDGTLLEVTRGLHRLPVVPWTFESAVWSGSLLGGAGARIGGFAAADVVGLADDPPDIVDVVAGGRVARTDQRWRFLHERAGVRRQGGRWSPPRIDVEVRYLRDVERAHGLPRGSRNRRHQSIYLTDVDDDPYALLVELDGRRGHRGEGRFRDMKRDNVHVVLGRPTLRTATVTCSGSRARSPGRSPACSSGGGFPTRCRRCVDADAITAEGLTP